VWLLGRPLTCSCRGETAVAGTSEMSHNTVVKPEGAVLVGVEHPLWGKGNYTNSGVSP
jgi:hypothetical protein